eukprot:Lithocolla_globosa_v1_NODE_3291_length_1710_cov_4.891239.p1 type:complete len:312 gc:universal NODE_3291_length_1710_cov_4.891239:952-17(-)
MTSEDTGTYGRDIGTSLPELLWKVVEVLPENVMLRLGMTNPPYILEHLEEMAKILNHPRVFSFLHVPVQAGSDKVLNDMRREYTAEDFSHVVEFLRERVPGITIATDIICGFPTETDQDFEKTLDIVRKYKFPVLFISQFYPRHGTPAALMPRVPTDVVKQRSRKITLLFEEYTTYDHEVGEIQQVLVTEENDAQFVGHNKCFEQILIEKEGQDLMGKMVRVKIEKTGKHYMLATLLDVNESSATSGKIERKLMTRKSSMKKIATDIQMKKKVSFELQESGTSKSFKNFLMFFMLTAIIFICWKSIRQFLI